MLRSGQELGRHRCRKANKENVCCVVMSMRVSVKCYVNVQNIAVVELTFC